nr:glycoside hydrolase domain-containing protein [Paraflavitalea speifideiaquila]
MQKPLVLPSSWGNDNKGGISIREEDNTVLVNNYSGSRNMKKRGGVIL